MPSICIVPVRLYGEWAGEHHRGASHPDDRLAGAHPRYFQLAEAARTTTRLDKADTAPVGLSDAIQAEQTQPASHIMTPDGVELDRGVSQDDAAAAGENRKPKRRRIKS